MTRPLQNAHNTLIADLSLMPRRDEWDEYPSYDDALSVSRDIADAGAVLRRYMRTLATVVKDAGADINPEDYAGEITSLFVALSEHAEEVWRVSAEREQSRIDDMKTDLMRERA